MAWILLSSDGHLIYWPSAHKVSVERNLIFDREKIKLSPTLPSNEPRVPTSKNPTVVPPIVPQVPSTPAHDSLSQSSGEGWIKEIIKPSPEHELEDLQLSQRPTIGPSCYDYTKIVFIQFSIMLSLCLQLPRVNNHTHAYTESSQVKPRTKHTVEPSTNKPTESSQIHYLVIPSAVHTKNRVMFQFYSSPYLKTFFNAYLLILHM